jgi:hypothetical protein
MWTAIHCVQHMKTTNRHRLLRAVHVVWLEHAKHTAVGPLLQHCCTCPARIIPYERCCVTLQGRCIPCVVLGAIGAEARPTTCLNHFDSCLTTF